MKAKDITKKLFADACDDLNAVMKLDPPIPTDPEAKEVTKATLEADLREAAAELQVDDVLKPKTVEVLETLGVEVPKAGTVEAGEEKKEERKEEKEESPLKNQSTKQPKFTRIQAVGQAFLDAPKDGISRDNLVTASDKIYADKGGKSNSKEAKWSVKLFLDVLGSVSLIKEVEGKFSS